MDVFCKNKQGFNTKDYKWHIFSGGGYSSIEGGEAQKAYEMHVSTKYIVMSNDSEPALLTDERPANLNYNDVYVFPENMGMDYGLYSRGRVAWPLFCKASQLRSS